MKVLMIFLDGFGIGANNETNPYTNSATPFMDKLLDGHILFHGVPIISKDNLVMIPTDAGLGVPGIPQSATGQTTLWTGINAAREVGRHINKFPTKELRQIINQHSIMKVLAEAGKKVTFANAYRDEYFKQVDAGKMKYSSSTLVSISSGAPLRSISDLNRGNAVYFDFTNKTLVDWGYETQILTAREAGQRLARIASHHDFTLYESFVTDHIGHSQDKNRAIKMYEQLDQLFASVIKTSDLDDLMVIITSDHGNIEDLSIGSHTLNQVPTFIIYNRIKECNWQSIKSLTDITPFILNTLLN